MDVGCDWCWSLLLLDVCKRVRWQTLNLLSMIHSFETISDLSAVSDLFCWPPVPLWGGGRVLEPQLPSQGPQLASGGAWSVLCLRLPQFWRWHLSCYHYIFQILSSTGTWADNPLLLRPDCATSTYNKIVFFLPNWHHFYFAWLNDTGGSQKCCSTLFNWNDKH